MAVTEESVVLMSDAGEAIGATLKSQVHSLATPLHLAFSLYLFDADDRLLLTRRALDKRTWPGVWTNTCCGHPGPGEDVQDAMVRRIGQELGLTPKDVELALPEFGYTAQMVDGTTENEFCPVFRVVVDADPEPDPAEVAEWVWVDWADLVVVAERAPWLISPWAALQVPQLSRLSRG